MTKPGTEWSQRRSEFSHDWLKNRFLNRLGEFDERLKVPHSEDSRLRRFIDDDLPQWLSHRPALEWLCDHCEECMSPRTLFEIPPLSNASADTKAWLPMAIHDVWVARTGIRRKISDLRESARAAHESYTKVADTFSAKPGIPRDEGTVTLVEEFRDGCRQVSEGISQLPRTVQIA